MLPSFFSSGVPMRHPSVLGCLALLGAAACTQRPAQTAPGAVFTYREVMIPVRDGVHLQTVILTPVNQSGPLPIIFRRSPYGVPDRAPDSMPPDLKELAKDGYIF